MLKLFGFSREQSGIVHGPPPQGTNSYVRVQVDAVQDQEPMVPPPPSAPPPSPPQRTNHPAQPQQEPSLQTSTPIRLVFVRKIFSILFIQVSSSIASIYGIIYNPSYAKVIASSQTYNDAAYTVGTIGVCILLVGSFVKRRMWWDTWYIVLLVLVTVGLAINFVAVYNVALYMDYYYHALVLLVSLSSTCLAIVIFSLQPKWDFNLVSGITISAITGIITSSLMIAYTPNEIQFKGGDVYNSLVVCRPVSIVLGVYISILVRIMMTNSMMGDYCCDCFLGRCCGCGLDLKKTKEQWAIAVVQIYFCLPLTILLIVWSFICCLISMLGSSESEHERLVSMNRGQAESDRQRAAAAWDRSQRYW